jgi:hypothetical protein
VLASLPATGEVKTVDQRALNLAQGKIQTILPTNFKRFLHIENNSVCGDSGLHSGEYIVFALL